MIALNQRYPTYRVLLVQYADLEESPGNVCDIILKQYIFCNHQDKRKSKNIYIYILTIENQIHGNTTFS